jgi:hypothetical protein
MNVKAQLNSHGKDDLLHREWLLGFLANTIRTGTGWNACGGYSPVFGGANVGAPLPGPKR